MFFMQIIDFAAFGKLTKAARTKNGLKLDGLAEGIGESAAWVIKMEIGKKDEEVKVLQQQSDQDIIKKMQILFKVDINYFAQAVGQQKNQFTSTKKS